MIDIKEYGCMFGKLYLAKHRYQSFVLFERKGNCVDSNHLTKNSYLTKWMAKRL